MVFRCGLTTLLRSATLQMRLAVGIVFAFAAQARAQSGSTAAMSPPSPARETPNHHQLDFWIGKWNLTRILPDGTERSSEHSRCA